MPNEEASPAPTACSIRYSFLHRNVVSRDAAIRAKVEGVRQNNWSAFFAASASHNDNVGLAVANPPAFPFDNFQRFVCRVLAKPRPRRCAFGPWIGPFRFVLGPSADKPEDTDAG
jgi:hypothetical protein